MGEEELTLAASEEACRVYVGNLLPKAKESHLTSAFARFGTIHSVWVARRPPGFAFVRFASPEAARKAVDSCEDGAMEILGKPVKVQLAGDRGNKQQHKDKETERCGPRRGRRTRSSSTSEERTRHHYRRRQLRSRSRSRSRSPPSRSRSKSRARSRSRRRSPRRSASRERRTRRRHSRSSSRRRR